jgi:hypothetical protein
MNVSDRQVSDRQAFGRRQESSVIAAPAPSRVAVGCTGVQFCETMEYEPVLVGGEMSAYATTHLDDIAAEQWPYWAPIRHHFDIKTFGVNAWRGKAGDEVIKRHDETESGAPELYVVMHGHATFALGEDEIDAPAGTLVYVRDASVERVAFAKEDGTVVLSIGAAAEGQAFAPAGWDTSYLEGS